LPVWLSERSSLFTRRLVIVASNAEAKRFVDHMKRYYDGGCNEWAITFEKSALAETRVVSIEDLVALSADPATVRLDDLSFRLLPVIAPCVPSAGMIEKVKAAVAAAQVAARGAVEDARRSNPYSAGAFGFASVVTRDAHTEITEALLRLGSAHASGSLGYYFVYEATRDVQDGGLVYYARIAAEAAADSLQAALGQEFDVRWRED
jgi:hypothetical protein